MTELAPLWHTPDDPPPFGLELYVRIGKATYCGGRILSRKLRVPVWMIMRGRAMVRLRRTPDAWRPMNPKGLQNTKAPAMPAHFHEAARALNEKPPVRPSPPVEGRAWWLDANAITYSPPGARTPHEVEGRVMRMLNTCRADRMPDPRGPGSNSDWIAKMVAKVEVEMGLRERASYWHDKFQPTARDLSDAALVIEWLSVIAGRSYEIVALRSASPPFSWRQISEMPGMPRTPEKAQDAYRTTLNRLTNAANGRRLDAA